MSRSPVQPDHSREGALLNQALELPLEERRSFLDQACAGEPELRERLQRLLHAHARAGDVLEQPPAGRLISVERDAVVGTTTEPAPERVGRYRLVEKLGEGGFGTVYLAEQREPFRRRVALKIIKLGMDSRQIIARFEAERQALALMDHPNIAKVLDAGTTRHGRPYFVMELVRGIKITEYCDRNRLSTADRLKLVVQVCRAVQHAHQKGIVHRDLKPSNILVTLHDGVPVPKVIDFGIAKATQHELTDKTLVTYFHQFLGTPAYMSPEQAEMSGLDIDTRSDIYSLGVLLYELLTGRTPFDPQELVAAGLEGLRRTIREKNPPRPSTRLQTMVLAELNTTAQDRRTEAPKLIHAVRGDLDWIVMKALEKDRTRRYETANGLARDIERHLHHEAVVARPPSALYRFQTFVRRNRMLAMALAAVFASLSIGLVLSTWQAVVATQARRQARRAEQKEAAEHQQADAARDRALRAEQAAKLNLYIANLNLAQQDYEQGNLSRLRRSLHDATSDPKRGFEWFYWQRQTHQEIRTFSGHRSWVCGVDLSPDGRFAATVAADETTVIWEVSTGSECRRFPYGGGAKLVNFSRDGRRLALSGPEHGIMILEVPGWRPVKTVPPAPSSALGLSPDGQRLALGLGFGRVQLWEVDSAKLVYDAPFHTNWVSTVRFSPDGTKLLTASWDATAALWRADTGECLQTFVAPGGWVYDANFSPDARQVVTAHFGDRAVRVWNAETGELEHVLQEGKETVFCAAFSPDGARIYSAGWDQDVKVWEARTGQRLFSLPKGHTGGIMAMAVGQDGKAVLTGSWDSDAKLWDCHKADESRAVSFRVWPNDHEEYRFGESLHGPIVMAERAPGQEIVLLPTPDHQVEVRELSSGQQRAALAGHTDWITAVAWTPDAKLIATASWDRTANVWDACTGQHLHRFEGHTDGVKSVAFTHDGQRLVTGSGDRTVRIWSLSLTSNPSSILPHPEFVHCTEFSPDDRWLATSDARTVRIWDPITERAMHELRHAEVYALAWSPDRRRLATGSFDGLVRIWDAAAGALLAECSGHISPVWVATFSADGQRLLSGAWNGHAKLWDVETGRELLSLKGHRDSVISVAFSADGERIFTGSEDQTVRIWEAASMSEATRWHQDEQRANEYRSLLKARARKDRSDGSAAGAESR